MVNMSKDTKKDSKESDRDCDDCGTIKYESDDDSW